MTIFRRFALFKEKNNINELCLLGLLFVVAISLRVIFLNSIPEWFTDEAFYMTASWNIIHGNFELFGVTDWTFLSPIWTMPPLYLYIIGPLLLLFGKTILVLRIVSVVFSIATIALMYIATRKIFSSYKLALLVSAVYATMPLIVVNNRWGLPQNIIGFLILLSAYYLWKYFTNKQPSSFYISVASLGLASLMSFWVFLIFPGVVLLIIKFSGFKNAFKYLIISGSFIVVVLGLRAFSIPELFWIDVKSIFGGALILGSDKSTFFQHFLLGLKRFLSLDPFFVFSLIGMWFVKDKQIKYIIILITISFMVVLMSTRYALDEHTYSLLIFIPLLFVGLAGWRDLGNSKNILKKYKVVKKIIILIAVIMIIYNTITLTIYIARGDVEQLVSKSEYLHEGTNEEMQLVASFVNSYTNKNDYVIAPTHLNWLLEARSTSLVWTICYERRDQFIFLPEERFISINGLNEALLYVDDVLFAGDATICDDSTENERQAIKEAWELIYSTENFEVYQNPNINTQK